MKNPTEASWQPAKPEKLAKEFSRLGWLGFWIQVVMLIIPVGLLLYFVFLRAEDTPQRLGIDLSNYLSYGSLLVMLFTTFWFFVYTRIAKRIADRDRRPSRSVVERKIWVGLWAGSLGILFSLLLLFSAVGRMLFILLANPQTGIMVAPGPGADPVQSISAIDAVSLSALLVTLSAELVVLGFSIWLLFRTTRFTQSA